MDNAELAYLLGMITGKGIIIRDNNQTCVIVEIPHKNLESEGMNSRLSVKASLDDIRNSIEPLIGTRIISTQIDTKTIIKFTKPNEDFMVREINRYFERLTSCKEFRIPQEIMYSPLDIKREFMIGLADVTAHIRSSNAAFGLAFNQRTYIEIPVNWYLVADIGNILTDLGVAIHNINWGHPNMRDPKCKYYNKGQHNAWFKEHQIKIFADEFEKIGFRIVHKMEALKHLANKNREEWDKSLEAKIARSHSNAQKEKFKGMLGHIELVHHKYYWHTKETERHKMAHPMENSDKIPSEIRGRHFDSWKELSSVLGYPRRKNE
ncbi:MAG: hypothetical protein PHO67_05180 [Candidatus Omnitrophica bacterium]|nr:hypothetical protein [Candidatus Omnitrophota bacterium]